MRVLFLFVLITIGGVAHPALGQNEDEDKYTLVLRGVPMAESLEQLVRVTGMDLVYTSEMVAHKYVYCAGRLLEAEQLLRCVLANSLLDYVRSSSGAYVLIETMEDPPRFGNLSGRIIDGETGEPLPYANVLLADASTGTTTNEDGLFSFSSLMTGAHRMVVSYVGYEMTMDSVWVTGEVRQRVDVALQAKEVALGAVVVNGLEQRLPSRGLGASEATPVDLMAISSAGTPDVARGATRIAGVTVQQPVADLHIQGGASGEHLMLLDGVPVRDPVSLGRHLGAFSPLAIKRLTVHKAGFGAEHGSHLSGVVVAHQDVAASAATNVVFSADPVSLNGRVQTRFALPGTQQGALMLALRHSVWDLYQDPGTRSLLQHWKVTDPQLTALWLDQTVTTVSLSEFLSQPDITFSDAHAALFLPLSPFRMLRASVYRAGNHVDSELGAFNQGLSPDTDNLMLTRDDYDWLNWAGQVRHSWLLGARSVFSVQALGSYHDSQFQYRARRTQLPTTSELSLVEQATNVLREELLETSGALEENRISEFGLKADWGYSLSPRYQLELGLEAKQTHSEFQFGNQFIAPVGYEGDLLSVASYAKGSLSFGALATLEPSVRLTYVGSRQTVYAEPRLSLRYDRAESNIGPYALRVAAGYYRQFINSFELTSSGAAAVVPYVVFWLPVDDSMAPTQAYHLAGDVLLLPNETWTVQLESYLKVQPRLLDLNYPALMEAYPSTRPTPDPEMLSQAMLVDVAEGHAYGGSIRVERKGRRLATEVSYGYNHTRRTFPGRFNDERVPAPWSEPHRLGINAKASVWNGIGAEAHWRGVWGRTWAFRRAYYDYLTSGANSASFAPYNLDDPAQQTLPAHHNVDVGVTYTRSVGPVSVQVRAFVVNLTNRANVFDRSLEPTGDGWSTLSRTLPGRHTTFALRLGY